jgi:sugar phosphate isomerase/epimerase
LLLVKIKDPGATETGKANEEFVRSLAAIGFDGWVVYELDRAWLAHLPPPETSLTDMLARLHEWTSGVPAGV